MTGPTATDPVQFSIKRGLAKIHLNRPDASNALNPELASALEAAVDKIAAEPTVRVLVLSGGGKNFCAGGDVRRMAAAPDTSAFLTDLAATVHRALLKLDSIPITVVAAVRGSAAGAGLGLVLTADFVVAGPKTRFAAAYGAVGLSPDCGVSILLPRTVGPRRAAQMLLSAKVLTGEEALDWGLITDLVDDGDIDERADELAAQLADSAHPATGQTRRLMRVSAARSHATHLQDEAQTIAEVSASEDAGLRIGRFASR